MSELSITMAERLKDLRKGKGLSHERLSAELKDSQGVSISSDSLMNYEVTDQSHPKAYKNDGMRAEYVRALAAFYGVSADYILGFDVPKSQKAEVRALVEYTSISEESIERLHSVLESDETGVIISALCSIFIDAYTKDCRTVESLFTLLVKCYTATYSKKEYSLLHSIDLEKNGLVAVPPGVAIKAVMEWLGKVFTDELAARMMDTGADIVSSICGGEYNGKHPGTPE